MVSGFLSGDRGSSAGTGGDTEEDTEGLKRQDRNLLPAKKNIEKMKKVIDKEVRAC